MARIRSPLLSRVLVVRDDFDRLFHLRQQVGAVAGLREVRPEPAAVGAARHRHERRVEVRRAPRRERRHVVPNAVRAVLRIPARHPDDPAPAARHFGHVDDRPRVDLRARREVRPDAAEEFHVGMELAHVVGEAGALIEVLLDDEAPHARGLRPRIQIQRIVGSRGLTVARPVAVGILMRVHVDAAVLDRGVGDDRIAQLHRRSAAAGFAASLRSGGAALTDLPSNERASRHHSGDDEQCGELMSWPGTHHHLLHLQRSVSCSVTSPCRPANPRSCRPTGCSARTRRD